MNLVIEESLYIFRQVIPYFIWTLATKQLIHDVSFPERSSDPPPEHIQSSRDELTKSAFYISLAVNLLHRICRRGISLRFSNLALILDYTLASTFTKPYPDL